MIPKIIEKSKDREKSHHHPHQGLNGVKMKMNHLQPRPITKESKDKSIKIHGKQKRKRLIFYYLAEILTIQVGHLFTAILTVFFFVLGDESWLNKDPSLLGPKPGCTDGRSLLGLDSIIEETQSQKKKPVQILCYDSDS